MRLVEKGDKIEIWEVGDEFFVYGLTFGGDPRVCPSLKMAHEIAAAGAADPHTPYARW
jgi:hypothetical protein